ncbi:MAG TPA: efflux RND transporter periplasmic adaptor subunit [Polyangia bacterium]
MKTKVCLLVAATLLASCKGKREPVPANVQSAEKPHHAGEGKPGAGVEGDRDKAAHADESIELTAEAVRSAGIKLGPATRKPLSAGIGVAARIAFDAQKVAKVAPRIAGRLASVAVRLGDKVKQGAVLAFIESPELGKTRAEYLAAATRARIAQSNFLREQELVGKGISSQREMREAEAASASAQADLESADAALHALGLVEHEIRSLKRNDHLASRFPVRSPLAGSVVEIAASLGQSVEATAHLLTVADLDQVWALADVYENQLQFVKKGQKVSLDVAAVPGRRFEGVIEYVGDVVEEKTRAVEVRVVVSNRDRALKPGMFATAEIASGAGHAVRDGGAVEAMPLVVPTDAVQQVGNEQVVFVAESPTRFKAIEVKLGRRSAAEAEILGGLTDGRQVVIKGAFVLKSELSKESMGERHGH